MPQHIFLSPHLDDVVLSCGGTLAHLTTLQVEIKHITIFAGIPSPTDPLSDFATHQHQMWGAPQRAYDMRRAEDVAALAYFGLQAIWLDFFDCIYRGWPDKGIWYYNSDEDIFGALHPAEFDAVWPIVEAVEALIDPSEVRSQTTIYAPLTVGNHVDHQLAFLAALQILAQGYTVCFYEEYPYAGRDPANLAEALNITAPLLLGQTPPFADKLAEKGNEPLWRSEVRPFSERAADVKIEAIAAYETQLEVLFGGLDRMRRRVTAYAAHVGQHGLAERFWWLNL